MIYKKISWNKFDKMIEKLSNQIIERKLTFDGIFGIPRGGLIPAVCLSHKLNLPILLYPTKKTLIVDDISDTGNTLLSFKNNFIATLHTTNWTLSKPNCWVEKKKNKNQWIVYPWEKK